MSCDENRISDQIDGGLIDNENLINELIESHFELFRRLNQVNNKNYWEVHNEVLEKAKIINQKLSKIKQSEKLTNKQIT